MNVAAWLHNDEWHLFTSELNRVVKDQGYYQANLKGEEERDLVLIRISTKDMNSGNWYRFVPSSYSKSYTPVAWNIGIPKELQALLTIYGL
ncbi:hypothetical protein [Pseudomonas phage vB_Pae_HMKU_23]|nr:hypothetical protein [Pseudomonas phage vB_Pae_HMKU_23]